MNSQPNTLRQLAGLSSEPATLAQSVILVIDAQKEYTQGLLPLSGIDHTIDALAAFLTRARALNTPIIHVVQLGKPGGKLCDPDGPHVAIIDALKPLPGELVIEKRFPSSFTRTTLQEHLIQIGKQSLIITGYMTHMCVNSTTRDAAEAGYACTLVSELTATRDLPDGQGGVIPAATVKAVNLATLADRFAVVVDKAEDLK